ncbi:MAG: ice-binding family protein, partial [Candidatus Cybelea sp.]
MRTSTPFGSALSAGAILALLAGCSGAGSGGSSALAPLAQTSRAQRQPIVGLQSQSCPAYSANRLYVPLKTSSTFAVLGASTVTSTGLTVLNGDLGLSPGTSITGFPPGIVNGSIDAGTPVAAQAQMDMASAYNHIVAMKNPTLLSADIGGTTIVPGLYNAPVSLGITGTVTLDGQNHADSYFVFQIPSTLTTSVDSSVTLTN